MKIRSLYLLLSLFLFGAICHNSAGLHKDHSNFTKTNSSISLDLSVEEAELSEEEVDFDHPQFISNYNLQLVFIDIFIVNEFSQTHFLQRHLGGHSGLSPPYHSFS
ncbi:hypothetical protein BALOs_1014 [Halobacteriovorax sp. BALOs_7]|uniref:Uncharacterized protein n=1 Tax=Halobacteriovorax vibrionivorans TaxID=2152716 RepID=A0ABY0IET2_9BACT|nr:MULTISPECIES: hypothetical protein [Halobacteriovorax]AYF44024.1 hypothetical protein BALOs_1014 [Halobacteriovorax sp. BALOs_7]RZF21449.1 hypothetical protein DAY19_07115 [Halobacteriovorax vibrionivorans]TGD48722.1 hypothetical protein EP118_02590 [Halobacteriovorax sp. Y22]